MNTKVKVGIAAAIVAALVALIVLDQKTTPKDDAAKAAAGIFGVPLLRLDFGVLYSKYYGETERNLRKALETAEVMAPCVLWLDEIEKGAGLGFRRDGDPESNEDVLAGPFLENMIGDRRRPFGADLAATPRAKGARDSRLSLPRRGSARAAEPPRSDSVGPRAGLSGTRELPPGVS